MRHLFFVLLLSVVTFHSIAYAQQKSGKKPPEPVKLTMTNITIRNFIPILIDVH